MGPNVKHYTLLHTRLVTAVITDPSARCPPVAVCNCWRPSLHHCWCSVVEQFASRDCCVWHTYFRSSTENL